ncbi:MAG: metalloregulator ArsR/SmtB family transcription factor [Hyphomicrobiaceae bacterium]|nr:metalloregulator ArsR/SmtB family transcription factor [Hyphomicrobiaceae bacterium]
MKEHQALDMLHALSQETRLRIVRHLVRRGEEGATAGEIGKEVNAASSRASFHLSALEHAGAVTSQRRSRNIIYRANVAKLGNMMSFLLDNCCDNHPDIRKCCLGAEACC